MPAAKRILFTNRDRRLLGFEGISEPYQEWIKTQIKLHLKKEADNHRLASREDRIKAAAFAAMNSFPAIVKESFTKKTDIPLRRPKFHALIKRVAKNTGFDHEAHILALDERSSNLKKALENFRCCLL